MKRILILALWWLASSVYALNPSGFEQYTHLGHVMVRAPVTTEDGEPVWAEYNEQGGHSRLRQLDGQRGIVRSGAEIRAYQAQLAQFRAQYQNAIEILNIDQFRGGQFLTADDRPITGWPSTPSDALVVVIPAKEKRFNDKGRQIDHYFFPVNESTLSAAVGDGVTSLFFDEDGNELYRSDDRIGLLTAYHTDSSGEIPDATEYDPPSGLISLNRDSYEVLGPVSGVYIETFGGAGIHAGASDTSGSYVIRGRLSPCPGFAYFPEVDGYARLFYSNFHPRGVPSIPYYLRRRSYNACIGYGAFPPGLDLGGLMAQTAVIGIVAGTPENITVLNYPVGVHMLVGQAHMMGVEVGGQTEYHGEASPQNPYEVKTDYDGDGQLDNTVRGAFNAEGLFEAKPGGDRYGVFFSASPRSDGQPNITRIVDTAPYIASTGLLKTISKEDFKNTDILVFRESTGELIVERSGLTDDESYVEGDTSVSSSFNFRVAVRSPEDMFSSSAMYNGNFVEFQAKQKVNPDLQSYKADFIRTGERIRIVMINRATGYIGSAITPLTPTYAGGDISVYVPPILMGPPNLKVWTTRRFGREGLLVNSDDVRRTISNEGAATTDDTVIEVHTEWLDGSGYPLPAGLKGRGYTGRVTRQVANDGDVFDSGVKEFAIDPGRQLQKLDFDNNQAYHHYVQVNAQPEGEQNDFSTGDHTGVLRHRPSRYVPVKVPLYDELGTEWELAEVRKSNSENDSGSDDIDLNDVPSRHYWVHRPELSFSVIDLTMNEILTGSGDDNDGERINILDDKIPVINSADDIVELIFNLTTSQFDRITPIEGERQYVLSLAGEEILVDVEPGGGDQTITFDNLDHLGSLQPEDFLTLSLYLNNDSRNVLWEWGFENLEVMPGPKAEDGSPSVIRVSADEAAEHEQVVVAFLNQNVGETRQLSWKASAGSVSNTADVSTLGVFSTGLKLPTVAGEQARVKALVEGASGSGFPSALYEVDAGAPAHFFSESVSGSASIAQQGRIRYRYRLEDRFGNPVEDGTSVAVMAEHMISLDVNDQVQGLFYTQDGEIEFAITGDYVAGNHELKLRSGSAEHSTQVDINDIQLTLSPIGTIEVGETVQVEVTASGNADGVAVSLAANRAYLDATTVIISGGRATASLRASDITGGGYVFARLGEHYAKQPFNVVSPDGSYALDTVLVSDAPSGAFEFNGKRFEYTNTTMVRLAGKPNEEVQASLDSLIEPLIDPLIYYDFNQAAVNDEYVDKQGNLNASAVGTSLSVAPSAVKGGSVITLDENDYLFAPWEDDYTKASNIGFTAQLHAQHVGTLITYAGALTLERQSDGSLLATANTSEGEVSVRSTAGLGNRWQKIGVHFRNGKLQLGVGKLKFEAPAPGTLETQVSSQLLTVGDSSNQQLDIAYLRLVDWNGVPMLQLDQPDGRYTVQADGFANARVGVPAAYIAARHQRKFEQLKQMYAQRSRFSLVSPAYAGDLNDCLMQPIDEHGFIVARGWRMIHALSECYIGAKRDKAVVRYETAEGQGEVTVAFIEKNALEGLYWSIGAAEQTVLVAKDCGDGFITGNMDNMTQATCSVASSFVVYGDLRDLSLQSYYFYIDDEENFSAMDATFASLGLAGAAMMATGVGSVVGLPVKIASGAAKVIPKAFRGARFLRPLASVIDARVMTHVRNDNYSEAAESFLKIMPFIELSAFVGFMSFTDEGKPVRDFISSAIENQADLEAWITYVGNMSTAITDGLISKYDLSPSEHARQQLYALTTEFLFAQAHASFKVSDLETVLVRKFIDIIDEVRGDISKYPDIDSQPTLARYFTKSLEALNEAAEGGAETLADVKFKPHTLRLLILAYTTGGEAALKGLRNIQGYKDTVINLSYEDLFRTLVDFDYTPLSSDDIKQVGKCFEYLGSSFTKSQGAVGELLVIGRFLKDGRTVNDLQKRVAILAQDGTRMGSRDSDLFVDGIFADVKMMDPKDLLTYVKLKVRPGSKIDENPTESGQFFRDLIDMGNNEGLKKMLIFPPHAKGKEGDILEAILDAAAEDRTRSYLMKAWGLDPKDLKAFDDKLEGLMDKFIIEALEL
jgi:hypothetical protein